MSSVNLKIALDRPTRTYLGGENVTGTAIVHANDDVRTGGLTLEYFWKTHGRGNTDRGGSRKQILYRGLWRAGETYRYRFRFPCPSGPPTYRGHYINVDHYVRLQADIPWAFDPKVQEEFLVLPTGRRPEEVTTSARLARGKKADWSSLGVTLGIVLIVFGVLFLVPLGLFMIPAGAALAGYSGRKWLAEQKTGEVTVHWGPATVSAGEKKPIKIGFTPRQKATLGAITLKLTGKESCTSGSGTDKTTHTYEFYEKTEYLAGRRELAQGQRAEFSGVVQVPATRAFSFTAPDNKIMWELEARIDIPLWPDWVEARELTVIPAVADIVEAEIVEQEEQAEPLLYHSVEILSEQPESGSPRESSSLAPRASSLPASEGELDTGKHAWDAASLPAGASQAATEIAHESDAEMIPLAPDPDVIELDASDQAALVKTLDELAAADRFGGGREKLLEQVAERPFPCRIKIERVERTLGYVPDARFRDGRTVVGQVVGSGHVVSVRVPADRNAELDELSEGRFWESPCIVRKWDWLDDHAQLETA